MKQGVYKFFVDYGKMGTLEGVFVEYDTVIAAAIGCEIDFGEALGKHTEVFFNLSTKEIKLLTDDPAFVPLFQEHIGNTGRSPIAAIADREGGSDEFWTAYDAAYPGHALPEEVDA